MNSMEVLWRQLVQRIEGCERVIARQQSLINNLVREAKVVDVDAANGLAVVDAHGVISKPIPWLQQAGSIVDWEPPAKGQRMVMISPNGDIGRGFLLPGGYTESVPQPYGEGAMFGRHIGATKIYGSDGAYNIETGTFTIKANIVIEGNVRINGASLTHNGKNVGSDHNHTGVMPGGALTGPPS